MCWEACSHPSSIRRAQTARNRAEPASMWMSCRPNPNRLRPEIILKIRKPTDINYFYTVSMHNSIRSKHTSLLFSYFDNTSSQSIMMRKLIFTSQKCIKYRKLTRKITTSCQKFHIFLKNRKSYLNIDPSDHGFLELSQIRIHVDRHFSVVHRVVVLKLDRFKRVQV